MLLSSLISKYAPSSAHPILPVVVIVGQLQGLDIETMGHTSTIS